MLSLDKLAKIDPYSDEWYANRVGMITSSEFSSICSYQDKPNELPKGAITYLDRLFCEKIVGKSNTKNISSEAIVNGVENEPVAIKYYYELCKGTDKEFQLLDKNQIIVNEYEASTPDSLILRNGCAGYNETDRTLDCETLEVKCPLEYAVFRSYSKLRTPEDLKKLSTKYYWQKIHQLLSANCRFGNWICFHKDFIGKDETKIKPMYHLRFDQMELREDIKFARLRTNMAIKYLQTI